jgi:hypothetical protein
MTGRYDSAAMPQPGLAPFMLGGPDGQPVLWLGWERHVREDLAAQLPAPTQRRGRRAETA